MRQTVAYWALGGLAVATLLLAAKDQRRPSVGAQPPATSKGLVAIAEIGGLASAVAADAQYAYLAVGRRLVVLSYSAHTAPTLVGETKPIAFDPRQVVLGSGVVYMVDALLGLHVIDVSDRQRPAYVRTLRCADEAMGMAVAGSYGYLACGQAGLAVIDLSQPREPRVVAELDSPRFARSVAVSGEHVLVAERDAWVSGLWIVNVRNPLRPTDGGFLLTPGGADYVVTDRDVAFVLGASGSLWVVDIADPSRPTRIGRAELEQGTSTIPGYPATGVPVYGLWATPDYLYVAHGERGLRVVDVRYRRRPLAVATLDTPGEARGLAVFGRRPLILVADGVGGLRVVDGENPALPKELYAYDESPGAIRDVATGGDYLCIVSQVGQLTSASSTVVEVADLSLPARPVLGSGLELGGTVRSVSAGASARGPEICAVSQSPAVRYQVDRSGRPQVSYQGGLQLVDVANRSSPRLAAAWDGAYLMNVAFGKNVFYGAWLAGWWPGSTTVAQQTFTTGLVVIDDRRLHALDELSHLALPGQARWVAADGDTVYVAAWNAGLHIVSVSDPRRPKLLGSLSLGANARSVAIVRDVALLGAEGVGLVAVDVSDPANPRQTSSVPLVGGGQKVEARGDYAIVTDGELGVNLIDTSDPRQPRWLDRFVPPLAQVRAVAATMGDEYVYLGVDPGTLLVLQIVDRPFPTPSTTPPTPRPTRTPEPTLTPSPTLDITAEPEPTEEPTASPTATPPPALYAPWLGCLRSD